MASIQRLLQSSIEPTLAQGAGRQTELKTASVMLEADARGLGCRPGWSDSRTSLTHDCLPLCLHVLLPLRAHIFSVSQSFLFL